MLPEVGFEATGPHDPVPAAGDDTGEGRRRKAPLSKVQRRLLLVTVALVCLGLFIGGGLLGYRWSNSRHRPTRAAATAPVTTLPKSISHHLAEPAAQMPDIVGLEPDEALEALADIGIDSKEVTRTEHPQIGTAGLVYKQSPVRATSAPSNVTLLVATPATVPALTGKTFDEAKSALDELGSVAVKAEQYDPNAAVGSVLSTDPAEGTALTPSVTVTVAASPSSIFVGQVDGDTSCLSGKASANGNASDNALTCSRAQLYEGSEPSPVATYEIGQGVDRFTATLTLSDDGSAGDHARVRVVLDGNNEVFNQIVTYKQNVPLDVKTTGANKLEIFVTSLSPDDESWNDEDVVFFDATFFGVSSSLDRLGTP